MLVLLCLVSVIIILSLWVLIVIKFRPAVRWPVVPKDGEEEVVRAFVPGETSLLPLAGDLSGNSFFGRERARKYNSDIYYIWSMWEPILVLGNPSAAQTFFKDQAKHLRQRDAGMGYVVRCMLGQCLGTQDTEWKRQRRVFDHPFRADNVNHFLPLMERSVERWLQDNLSEQSSVTAELSTLGLLPFGMFARFVYGLDMPDADIQRLLELHRLHDQVLNAGTSAFAKLFPYEFMKYLPLSNNKQLAEFERQWKDFNLRYKKKYQNQLAVLQHDSQTASCVFSQVLHKQATSNTYLSDEEFFQTLDEILFTNVEITYGALAWAVYHLAGNPNVQQQLREEIQGKTIASVHDLKELQYLDCVVKESARIQPSVSLTIPERTVKDMVLGGYSIPSGTLVSIDTDTLNHHPQFWDEPDEFKPERFTNKQVDYAFHRFGLGARRCLGYRFADTLTKLLLAKVVSRYNLHCNPETRPKVKQEGLPFFTPFTSFPHIAFIPVDRHRG